jgi:hypothetical protein
MKSIFTKPGFWGALLGLYLLTLAGMGQAQDQTTTKQTAADKAAAYTRTITQRADKIVTTLDLADAAKATRVRDLIVQQYHHLNEIHTGREELVQAAKGKAGSDKAAAEARIKTIEAKTRQQLTKRHGKYLARLGAELTPAQVEQVKDGMTYGVVPITYKGYLAMLPNLTGPQKARIMTWLVEARELAMDAESSEKKHATFGKYKGRINNYLSAAGYNLKQAGEDWQKRLQAEQAGPGK